MKRSPARNDDAELRALVELRDEEIDTSDIPEKTDWSRAVPGRFYRPIKEPVTIRLDADVVAWLKSAGPGYQTRINALLRDRMMGEELQKSRKQVATTNSSFGSRALAKQRS